MIKQRLIALRTKMKEKKIDYYLISSSDPHSSEYICDYYKTRQYFSNFTGSNGTLLVWQSGAALWTDGRYFIQAAKELEGTSIKLFKSLEKDVPTIEEFLKQNLSENQVLGIDGMVFTAEYVERLNKVLAEKRAVINTQYCLASEIWQERPQLPNYPITYLTKEYTGMEVSEKIQWLRETLEKESVEAIFLTKLDQIMWLFNIRGSDIHCNPVAISYAYISQGEVILWLQEKTDKSPIAHFSSMGIVCLNYEDITEHIEDKANTLALNNETIWIDKKAINETLFRKFAKVKNFDKVSPIELKKAVKNQAELEHMRTLYLKDSVAVTKFIYWVQNRVGKEKITEITAAQYLEKLRKEIPEFQMLSFPTISAYKEHAAMMHYSATEETDYTVEEKGILLVDSGGQYLSATTDVTRSIVLGELEEEIKKHYTVVAAGMLQLMNLTFLKGCTGRNLDIMARQPIWKINMDYKCGTGHGIGCMLNVHEGPHGIRYHYQPNGVEVVFQEGMAVTNEPGIYIEGSHGIRIENVMVAIKVAENVHGEFLAFENLTWVPIDMKGIQRQHMNSEQWEYLKQYQKQVYEKVSPYLTVEEKQWLENMLKIAESVEK